MTKSATSVFARIALRNCLRKETIITMFVWLITKKDANVDQT
jgi:hypothetical protein